MKRAFVLTYLFIAACKPVLCEEIALGTPIKDLPLSNWTGGLPAYFSSSTLAGDCPPLDGRTAVAAAKGAMSGAFKVDAQAKPRCSSKVPDDSYFCAIEAKDGVVACVYEFCSD